MHNSHSERRKGHYTKCILCSKNVRDKIRMHSLCGTRVCVHMMVLGRKHNEPLCHSKYSAQTPYHCVVFMDHTPTHSCSRIVHTHTHSTQTSSAEIHFRASCVYMFNLKQCFAFIFCCLPLCRRRQYVCVPIPSCGTTTTGYSKQ